MSNSQQNSMFFVKIPQEVRNMIFREVITSPFNVPVYRKLEHGKLSTPNVLPLLLTCRQLRDQSRTLLPKMDLEYQLDYVHPIVTGATAFSPSTCTWRLLPAFSRKVETWVFKGYYQGAESMEFAPETLEQLFGAGPGGIGLPVTDKATNVKVFEFHVHTAQLLTNRERTQLIQDLESQVKDAYKLQLSQGSVGYEPYTVEVGGESLDMGSHGWEFGAMRCFVNGEMVVDLSFDQWVEETMNDDDEDNNAWIL